MTVSSSSPSGSHPTDFWKGRPVLVTGGTGFIGSSLVEALLAAEAEVRVLVHYSSTPVETKLNFLSADLRERVEPVLGDVQDADTVTRAIAGMDTVFHLAALIAIPYSYQAPRSYLRTNAEGTLNVLAAGQDVRRIVHTSTSEVYGTAQITPMTEQHPIVPQSPYAASKAAADSLVESYVRSFASPAITARPFNTYGPRQSARAVIPTIIQQALRSDRIRLGSTTPIRDFNFVRDTASGMMALASSADLAAGTVLNLGSGRAVSIAEVVSIVGHLLGKELHVETDGDRIRPEASEVNILHSDSERARSLAGWAPAYTLEEGLAETIEWQSSQPLSSVGHYAV